MDLGTRMKQYEHAQTTSLLNKTPVVIRIDGKAFHTYTRNMEKPFSDQLHNAMVETTDFLTQNIQGAKIGYTQSDEISILLTDWEWDNNPDTQAWFNNKLAKILSVSASYATGVFNQAMSGSGKPLAFFDSRAFNLPPHEVTNYFIWRQQDASRNSVQMLARAYFSHNELHGKNNSQIQDMLMLQHGVNWNDIDTWKKRGTCIQSHLQPIVETNDQYKRVYIIDEDIPIFTKDRDYIGKHVS